MVRVGVILTLTPTSTLPFTSRNSSPNPNLLYFHLPFHSLFPPEGVRVQDVLYWWCLCPLWQALWVLCLNGSLKETFLDVSWSSDGSHSWVHNRVWLLTLQQCGVVQQASSNVLPSMGKRHCSFVWVRVQTFRAVAVDSSPSLSVFFIGGLFTVKLIMLNNG